MNAVYTLIIFDFDVGQVANVQVFSARHKVENEVLQILDSVSFEEGFDPEEEKVFFDNFAEAMRNHSIIGSLRSADLTKQTWVFDLPGNHRQITVDMSEIDQ